MRTTRPITISLPADLLREAERMAKEDARSRSELVRDALRQYLASRRWQRLRRWGAETARRLGLKTEDDLQRLLERFRGGRRKTRG
ncbi:MAG: ribbon-helix-helix protein, CopG family [Candidatus Rokubacteria bacterium]|nr:ribbon-helix-helix protein, CopG family [Candidatus Rokubacteria bacterium]